MKIKISKKSLIEEFNFLKESMFLGVKGVTKIDSGKIGPVFGLTICTHGNELAGLAAVYYLRNKYNLNKKLLKGSILIVVNNLNATQKALKAKNEISRLNSRYIDLNFNRLPKNLIKINNDNRYEIGRAKELLPIWNMFDVALDIHSTTQNNPPMIIASNNLDFNLIKNFPIKKIITNIIKIQIGVPAFNFYGGKKKIQTIEIEAGQHEKSSSYIVAIKCILSLLEKKQMIKFKKKVFKTKVFEEYYVYNSIIFPDKQCKLSRVFTDFEVVKKGEVLAKIKSKVIKTNEDSCILMAPKGKKCMKYGEETIFLSKLPNKIIYDK